MHTSSDHEIPQQSPSTSEDEPAALPRGSTSNGLTGLAILGAASVAGLGAVYLLKASRSRRDRRVDRTASRIVSELRRLERRAERRLKTARREDIPAIMDGANAMMSNAGSLLSQLANTDWRPYYDRLPSLLERLKRG